MKARELIDQAYFNIGKLASEQPVKPAEDLAAIRKLNNIMYSKADLGLGYTIVSTAGDDITTPNYSWRWMEYALSVDLHPQFGTQDIDFSLLKSLREEAYSDLLDAIVDIPPPELTGNVPLGSGNTGFNEYGPEFYTETDDGVLTEQNSIIVTEDS